MSGGVHPSALQFLSAVGVAYIFGRAAELRSTLRRPLSERRFAFELVREFFMIGHLVGVQPCREREPVVPFQWRRVCLGALLVCPLQDLLLHLCRTGDLLSQKSCRKNKGKH